MCIFESLDHADVKPNTRKKSSLAILFGSVAKDGTLNFGGKSLEHSSSSSACDWRSRVKNST